MSEADDIRPIPLAPGYFASSDGRIFAIRRGTMRERKQTPIGRYFGLSVMIDGVARFRGSHRLICSAFHGLPPDDHEARHLDGNPRNNIATNLAWGTHSQNERDKTAHCRDNAGSRNGRALMTEETVARVKEMIGQRCPQTRIATALGVARNTIHAIASGANWDQIEGDVSNRILGFGERHHAAKLSDADVMLIRAELRAGTRRLSLAARFGVSLGTIKNIATGHTWKHVPDAGSA